MRCGAGRKKKKGVWIFISLFICMGCTAAEPVQAPLPSPEPAASSEATSEPESVASPEPVVSPEPTAEPELTPSPEPTVYPDIEGLEFADLDGVEFWFLSGVGAWGTTVEIHGDGTFTGNHWDADEGIKTRSYCSFSGQFSSLEKTGPYEYTMKCESLSQEGTEGDEELGEDGYRYVTSGPYGFDNAGLFILYLPGRQTAGLPEEFVRWVSMPRAIQLEDYEVLDFYGLYNVGGEQGFSSDGRG